MSTHLPHLVLLLSSATLAANAQASTAPSPAPGLTVPATSLPYALDHYKESPELVPIHHSTVSVNNHRGANLAGSLAGSFLYKPKMTTELAGSHARTVLHDAQPAFFLHFDQEDDTAGDSPSSETSILAIVRAIPDKDRRVFTQIRFNQLTGNAARDDHSIVPSTTEHLPGGWIKLTPQAPLTPGEYAITPVEKTQYTFSTVVFDFTLAPDGPNAPDAVRPVPASQP